MAGDDPFGIALDTDAKLRLHKISEETGLSIAELIRCSVEEAALNYFRNRKDDPGEWKI